MGLIEQIDDFIVDNIAQPLVDWAASLSNSLNKYWLARIFMATSIVGLVLIPQLIFKISLLSFIIPTGIMISACEKIDRRTAVGTMPWARVGAERTRRVLIFINIILLLNAFALSFAGGPPALHAAGMLATYFVSGTFPLHIVSCRNGGTRRRSTASDKAPHHAWV